MIALPPPVRLLTAMADRAALADFTEAGVASPVTIRHSRNRKPVRAERPAVTLILVGDEPRVGEELGRNMDETVREMTVDIQIDLELETEESDLDPTGLAALMRVAAVFVASLRDPEANSWLGGLCDWISMGALEPDDRSTPDDGRMTRAITVLYRVRSDDENQLLGAGVNG